MVGSAVAVKKVWKSLRTVKEKLRSKKRFRKGSSGHRRREIYDHYNYSDDEEMDSIFRKKLLKWKVKAMACLVGRAEVESKEQFVYVTDLYCSAPSAVIGRYEGDSAKVEKENKKASTSGSNPMVTEKTEENRKSMNCDVVKGSPSSPSKKKKSVGWNNPEDLEKGMNIYAKEVDIHADLFIAKFYDDMKLQRQKSLVEYREMLDRGAGSS